MIPPHQPRKANGQFEKGTHWRNRQPFWDKTWCEQEYLHKQRSCGDIAKEFKVTEAAILFWLRKHKIPRRTISESRGVKYWGAVGSDNPMWNKRGELSPNWQGGLTPARQECYTSTAWHDACKLVWKRDKYTCRRCGIYKGDSPDLPFHIHHVLPFAVVDKRTDPDNLVLLCEICHHYVHSKINKDGPREYLPKK